MTKKELKKILRKHLKWLNDEPDGVRADFSNTDLRGIDLCGANLSNAELYNVNLSGSDLRNANLSWADLRKANLSGADLSDADLHSSDLRNANLSNTVLNRAKLWCTSLSNSNLNSADLIWADLRGADLHSSDLRNANLSWAALRQADLSNTNLKDANIDNADLFNTDLLGAKYVPFIRMACPDEGSFIGWKKINNYIIKLEIPADAKRCSATSSKCRCEFAKVIEIQNLDGTKADIEEIINNRYDTQCVYRVGKIAYPDEFDEDRWNECSNGIHFFINRNEAVEYEY